MQEFEQATANFHAHQEKLQNCGTVFLVRLANEHARLSAKMGEPAPDRAALRDALDAFSRDMEHCYATAVEKVLEAWYSLQQALNLARKITQNLGTQEEDRELISNIEQTQSNLNSQAYLLEELDSSIFQKHAEYCMRFPPSPILEVTEALWNKVLDISLTGVFFFELSYTSAVGVLPSVFRATDH